MCGADELHLTAVRITLKKPAGFFDSELLCKPATCTIPEGHFPQERIHGHFKKRDPFKARLPFHHFSGNPGRAGNPGSRTDVSASNNVTHSMGLGRGRSLSMDNHLDCRSLRDHRLAFRGRPCLVCLCSLGAMSTHGGAWFSSTGNTCLDVVHPVSHAAGFSLASRCRSIARK